MSRNAARLEQIQNDWGQEIALCMGDYWRFASHVTTLYEEDEEHSCLLPYPLEWEYLVEFHQAHRAHRIMGTLKGRGLTITTDYLLTFLHESMRAAFHGHPYRAAVVRQSEDDVKELIRRVSEIYHRLPTPIQDKFPLAVDKQLDFEIEGGGRIQGMHAAGTAGRGEPFDDVLFDEGAFQRYLKANWSAFDRARRRHTVSTPNGPTGYFYEMIKKRALPRMHIHEIFYWHHPDRDPNTKKGQEWIELKRGELSESEWMREHEGSFDSFSEKGWYVDDFNKACLSPGDIPWKPRWPVIASFDFGFVHPAVVFCFVNDEGQWCCDWEFLGADETTYDFGVRVFEFAKGRYGSATWLLDGDPAGTQRKSVKSERGLITDKAEIEAAFFDVFGYRVNFQCDRIPGSTRAQQHDVVRRMFHVNEGVPGMLINKIGCPWLVEGCQGAYRHPENPTPEQMQKQEHNKTSDHGHIMDAHRYAIIQFSKSPVRAKYRGGATKKPVRRRVPIVDETGHVRGWR